MPSLRRSFWCWIWLCLLPVLPAAANHLVGGNLTYRFLDTNGPADKPWRYEITVYAYDNSLRYPQATPEVTVFIYGGQGYMRLFLQQLVISRTSFEDATPPTVPGCSLPLPPVTLGIYTKVVTLPIQNEGFEVVFNETFRIENITNISNSGQEPAHIPMYMAPGTIPNSSPVLSQKALAVACLGDLTSIPTYATDVEGDLLRYSLNNPGFIAAQPFGVAGSITVDANTGQMQVLSLTQGFFLVAVTVSEYRVINGREVLLSTIRRDMIVVVRACEAPPSQAPTFTPATLARQSFQITEGQKLDFTIAATIPAGQALSLTVSSELLDGPGGNDATFAEQPGSSGTLYQPARSVSIRGNSLASGVFHLQATCGLARRQPYYVLVTAAGDGCTSKNIVTAFYITVTRPDFPAFLTGDASLCTQSVGTYTVRGPAYNTYRWVVQGGQLVGPATGAIVQVRWNATGTGTVSVSGIVPNGCYTDAVSQTVTLQSGLPISGPTLYCGQQRTSLTYSVAGTAAYQWSAINGTIIKGQGTSQIQLEIHEDKVATLLVSDGTPGNCVSALTIAPDSTCLSFYNIITPNGDGRNDAFVIRNLSRFPNTALTIFNRWGRQIYQSADYRNTYTGEENSSGIYYYLCQLPDGQVYRGWFELVHN